MNMEFKRKLPIPMEIKGQYPVTSEIEEIKKVLMENEDYALVSQVELRLPGNGKGLTRHSGDGICTLNRKGLTYSGTKDGKKVECHFPIQRVYRLLFGAGENFEIYNGTQIFYFIL